MVCDSLCILDDWIFFFFLIFRDATQAYKAEALELQRQIRHLQSQLDMLGVQASTLIQGRRARVAATTTVNGYLTAMDDSLSARNLRVCWLKKFALFGSHL